LQGIPCNQIRSQLRAAILIAGFAIRSRLAAIGLAIVCFASAGVADEHKPMTAEQRMQARFPQPVRVGDLIGLPVLDDSASTLGHVRDVARTKNNKIELIITYDGFFGWGARPGAVPLEVVAIAGRHLTSLDMPRSEYAEAPTWAPTLSDAGAQLSDDTTIQIALSRH
jgi:PRC-barrel domain